MPSVRADSSLYGVCHETLNQRFIEDQHAYISLNCRVEGNSHIVMPIHFSMQTCHSFLSALVLNQFDLFEYLYAVKTVLANSNQV